MRRHSERCLSAMSGRATSRNESSVTLAPRLNSAACAFPLEQTSTRQRPLDVPAVFARASSGVLARRYSIRAFFSQFKPSRSSAKRRLSLARRSLARSTTNHKRDVAHRRDGVRGRPFLSRRRNCRTDRQILSELSKKTRRPFRVGRFWAALCPIAGGI